MTTALIAEDEPLLAQALRAELARAWPGLKVLEPAVDGDEAVERALDQRPDIVFLDIRMPGRSGVEAAEAIVEEWPDDAGALPLIVFVTAYDQYALQAFERAAVDYLQKPVQPGRLAACCTRLKDMIALRAAATASAPADDAALLGRLRALLGASPEASAPEAPLAILQASIGATLHMIPLAEVVYFEAADKYVRVVTATREALIRMSLRELLPRLRAEEFWQIHRGTVVRADAIATANRDDSGKVFLTLRQRPERLVASRLYAHLFRGM
ncbi:LytR/AlgR family response regulator transcription factor [Scleromatobacter humisilvae]|uniref:LytTR family DNA-binding domain-containing protein n=1 Tax=Scleromatobacter humisilvae TaxID=2897159 RepID=A0A9X2C0V8_9BURK|nr:LytTR family DNA-binding domain-containing protein [Scleromatobacter humisilvae]MCK9684305.1 LytTR family DNA-binding domain-containing protein [Scleromatobacter humisilvae]